VLKVPFYCSKTCQKQDQWRYEPDCDVAALKRESTGCGKEDEGCSKDALPAKCKGLVLQPRMPEEGMEKSQEPVPRNCVENISE